MPITTVGFLHPGAMGTSLAHVLAARLPHLKLLTSSQGRSEVIISRAESCGFTDVPFADFVTSRMLYYQFYPPVGLSGWPQKIIVHVKQDKNRYLSTPILYLQKLQAIFIYTRDQWNPLY